MSLPASLTEQIRAELRQVVPSGAHVLAAEIRARHGAEVDAILFYGSCLRRSEDREGLLDLYVLTRGITSATRSRWVGWLGALLPPNVFFLEVPMPDGGQVRAKVSVVSLAQFVRGTSNHCLEPYFWARFAQPCALVYARSPEIEEKVVAAASTAVVTLVRNGVVLMEPRFTARSLWVRTLTETYRGEIRPERSFAPERLIAEAASRYDAVTRAALSPLPYRARSEAAGAGAEGDPIEVDIPPLERALGRMLWAVRRIESRVLAALRLLKGAITFEGGIDYVLWKIERHSGKRPDPEWREAGPRVVALGRVFWQLYRQGAIR